MTGDMQQGAQRSLNCAQHIPFNCGYSEKISAQNNFMVYSITKDILESTFSWQNSLLVERGYQRKRGGYLFSKQHYKIIETLCGSKYVTADELAGELGISDRSVRKRIQEINSEAAQNESFILSKAHYGFYVNEQCRGRLEEILKGREKDQSIPITAEERLQFLMSYLLNLSDYIKIEDLCDLMYVSKGTVSSTLKQVETLYNRYKLTIIRRPNYGIKVEGTEFDIRRLMCEVFVHQNYIWEIGKEHQQMELKAIGKVISANMNKYNIIFSELGYQSFLEYIFVAIRRIGKNRMVIMELDKTDYVNKTDYYFTEAVASDLAKQYNIEWPENEKLALAVHLIGKEMNRNINQNFVIPNRINNTILEVLDDVYEEYQMDFRNNLDLRMSLCQHMVTMDIRLKYGLKLTNPMLEEIRHQYIFAFTIAGYACYVLGKRYHADVDDNEISYLALYFALALEATEKKPEKINILMVCVSERASAQFFAHVFKKKFEDYIDQLYICNLHDLEHFDFNRVNYLVTSVPIEQIVPVPILEINEFMTETDSEKIRDALEGYSKEMLNRYFPQDFFFQNIKGKTKGEILEEICFKIEQQRTMPPDFFESVNKREILAPTDFGNSVAFPHPDRIMVDKTFMAVGITEEPVYWGHQEVQVIFLALIGGQQEYNIQKFYQISIEFASDEQRVKQLVEKPDYSTFIGLLRQ